ncbi:unnamed protein product [Blepharisma stoltei]|uniref:Protein yippee-like n=1 Tax=Blepharisma stoltei TaxID=1481888 RepID=A0AAU9IPC2_9CILI|nr:unnamed protein product [Blepharisma stoltei]
MGKLHLEYLDSNQLYVCGSCKAHLTNNRELISKDFWAGTGKAYLYNKVVNIYTGVLEERMLRTGLHSCCDIFCKNCDCKLGWKYEWALEPEQKYKEGKFILEKNLIEKAEWEN